MRLAGQLALAILPAAAVLLGGLAVGVGVVLTRGAGHADAAVRDRLATAATADATAAGQRLADHGRSLAQMVAQTAPSFVVSDDLTTLEAMALQLAADADISFAAITDAKGRNLAVAWDGGSGAAGAAAARSALGDRPGQRVAIAADGTTYGAVEVVLSTDRLQAAKQADAADAAALGMAIADEFAGLRRSVLAALAIGAGTLLCVLAAGFAVVVRRRISRPLAQLDGLADAIAAGDLSHRVELARRDEVGQLAGSLERMRSQLEAKGRLAQAIAGGDLTVAVPIASERDALGKALAGMTTSLTQRMRELAQLSQQLSGMAEGLVGAAQRLDSALGEAGSNTQAVAAAMQEFQASFREIANGSTAAVSIAGEAGTAAEAASAGTGELIEAARQVAGIADVISAVAEKTNLLALNATIEAARAGDAGRGFAVVAGEVKALAGETAVSTGSINQRVARIGGESEKARTALVGIVAAVKRIGEAQQTIASSIEEQTAVAGEVARNLTGIGDATRGAAEASASLAASARDLSAVAASLRAVVATYRM